MHTINFMYFAHNFGQTQLDTIFAQLGNESHFRSKFNGARGENGTQKFLNWFMMLDVDNMEIVVNWINENYFAFKHFKL